MQAIPLQAGLAKIHIALKDLALDDKNYRELLWKRYCKVSAAKARRPT